MSNSIQLSETQKFRQNWVFLLLIAITLTISFFSIRQFLYDIPFGNNPASNPELALFLSFWFLLITFFLTIKLKTRYTENGIFYQMTLIHFKERFIPWSEIESVEMRKYNPIKEYGGWGLRLGIFGSGKAINMGGNIGVQLILKGGKKLLIGTQQPEAVKQYLINLGKLKAE